MTEISDYFAAQPSAEDEDLHTIITLKKEFVDLASEPQVNMERFGKLLEHQELIYRLFIHVVDNLLVFYGTGTGKTKIIVSICEYYKKVYERFLLAQERLTFKPYIERVIILVKGPSVQKNFIRELIKHSSKEFKVTDTGIRKIRSRERQFYIILTYGSLASILSSMSDDQIEAEYSGSAVFIDEGHNLRSDPDVKSDEKINTLIQLKRLTTHAKRIKLMNLTGTPCINSTEDVFYLLYLFPDRKGYEIDINDMKSLPELSERKMFKYFRGRVAYFRSFDIGIKQREMGVPIDGYLFNVYKCKMSELQTKVYHKAILKGKNKRTPFHQNEKQISNFVFPDGSYGTEGFKRHITTGKGLLNFTVDPSFEPYIKDLDKLKKLSPKTAEIIRRVKETKGVKIIFSDSKEGSGLYMILICLLAHGYERFTNKERVFRMKNGVKTLVLKSKPRVAVYIPETSAEYDNMFAVQHHPENIDGEKIEIILVSMVGGESVSWRYVRQYYFLSPSWHQAARSQALDRAFRLDAYLELIKKYGEIVVDVFNLCAVPNMKYIVKDEDDREEDGEEYNLDPEEDKSANILRDVVSFRDEESSSVDIALYKRIELKDKVHSKVIKRLMEGAIDSNINYKHNVREDDIKGSREMNYSQKPIKPYPKHIDLDSLTEDTVRELTKDIKYYKNITFEPEPLTGRTVDESTFDVYHSQELVEKILEEIIDFLLIKNVLTYSQILELCNSYKEKYVLEALNLLITRRQTLLNRFGERCFVVNNEDVFFLQNTFPHSTLSPYFTEILHVSEKQDFKEYASSMESERISEKLKNANKKEALEIFDTISVDNKSKIAEEIFMKKISDAKLTEIEKVIFKKVKSNLYKFSEPLGDIMAIRKIIDKKRKGKNRGRKAKNPEKLKIKKYTSVDDIEFEENPEGEMEEVYIHTVHKLSVRENNYGTQTMKIKADFKMRLYKPSEQRGWRDLAPYEIVSYNKLVQLENIPKLYQIEAKFDIYGIYEENTGRFLVRDTTKFDKNETDGRKKGQGRELSSWSWPDIVDLLWKLHKTYDMPLPSIVENISKPRSSEMRETLKRKKSAFTEVDNLDKEKLYFYYRWQMSNLKIKSKNSEEKTIPFYIKKFMNKNKMVRKDN